MVSLRARATQRLSASIAASGCSCARKWSSSTVRKIGERDVGRDEPRVLLDELPQGSGRLFRATGLEHLRGHLETDPGAESGFSRVPRVTDVGALLHLLVRRERLGPRASLDVERSELAPGGDGIALLREDAVEHRPGPVEVAL